MADLVITAANVLTGTGATKTRVVAGATITAGKALYKDTADGDKYKLAQANAAGTAACDGIALHSASDGQPLIVAIPSSGGNINLGATLAVGQTYVVSAAAAGGIAPISDLASTNHPVILGIATTTSNLLFGHIDAGVAKA